jgi:hypothetical protein
VLRSRQVFAADVRLVFNNAILYNGTRSDVGSMSKQLIEGFDKDMRELYKAVSHKAERESSLRKDEYCILCGVLRRVFEPIVLYCNGTCGMQKIRRNAT